METYRVIKPFTDLKDGNRQYCPGDEYPRAGLRVRQERISQLLGDNGGVQVIEPNKKKLRKE